MKIELYKHQWPYKCWVAYSPKTGVLLEYRLNLDKPLVFCHNNYSSALMFAEPCCALEFLVLFGVTLSDIKKLVKYHYESSKTMQKFSH